MNDEILIEPRPTPVARSTPRSNIKSILLHVQNDEGLERRLQLALALSRASGAHLECAQVTPIEAFVTTGTLGGILALGKAMEKVEADDRVLESRIRANLTLEDVSWEYERITGYESAELIRRAALADLIIVGRDAHRARAPRAQTAVLGDILSSSRTPLLVPGTVEEFDPFGPALIAWDGSLEAANAARAALGLLKMASTVRIVRFTEEKPNRIPDFRLAAYLSRHDIHAELVVREVKRDYVGVLVEDAFGYGASYIVMGGYGHSRFGEFLFGGVTRTLLHDCPLSLFIAH